MADHESLGRSATTSLRVVACLFLLTSAVAILPLFAGVLTFGSAVTHDFPSRSTLVALWFVSALALAVWNFGFAIYTLNHPAFGRVLWLVMSSAFALVFMMLL